MKMALLLPLLPLRLAVGGLSLVAIAVVNSLVAWNWPIDKPLTPLRRRIVLLSKELVLITLWCLGFRVRVSGRENINTAERLGAVAVFNHVSWVDAFVLVWLMAPSGVSKESNGRIPVIGHAVRALQTVYIPYDKLSKKPRPGTAPDPDAIPASTVTSAGLDGCSAMTAADSADSKRILKADRASSDGSCSSINSCNESGSDMGSMIRKSSCSSGSSNGTNRTDGGTSGSISKLTQCPAGAAAAPSGTLGAAATGGAANAGQAAPPCSPPAPPSAPLSGSRRSSDVVTSNVTEVLLRRVNQPSYCRPGGFPMLVMAPEGTTSNGRGLLNFRTGAFVLRRPVLPICLRYRWHGVNPAWTIGDERWHFLRLMCQFRNDLDLEILPPYKPSEDELKDCRLFVSHVRRLMASVLEVPLMAASHDDYLALRRRGVGVSWDGRRVTVQGGSGGGAGTGGGSRSCSG